MSPIQSLISHLQQLLGLDASGGKRTSRSCPYNYYRHRQFTATTTGGCLADCEGHSMDGTKCVQLWSRRHCKLIVISSGDFVVNNLAAIGLNQNSAFQDLTSEPVVKLNPTNPKAL
jgi:hypothetical protein